jgi:hypothetical protein
MHTVNFMANGQLLGNDPFVGKLYHFATNHASGLRLNKKTCVFLVTSEKQGNGSIGSKVGLFSIKASIVLCIKFCCLITRNIDF